MSEDEEYRDIYNDILILRRELENINKKIELIEIMQYYNIGMYDDMYNQELYYYSCWKNLLLEGLERLEGLEYGILHDI
jgi:hypothetical protein